MIQLQALIYLFILFINFFIGENFRTLSSTDDRLFSS